MNITIPAQAHSFDKLSLIPPRPQVTYMDMEPTASTSSHIALLHHPSDRVMAEAYGTMLKRLIPDIVIESTSNLITFDHKYIFILITDNYLDDVTLLKTTYNLFSRLKYNVVPVLTSKFEHRKLPICIKTVHADKLYHLIAESDPIEAINAVMPQQKGTIYYYAQSLTRLLKLDIMLPQ